MSVKNLLSFIFLLLGTTIYAQETNDLLIEYNQYSNKVIYKKNGIQIENPSIKESDNIYITITEFNPYIMRAELSVKQSSYNQTSSELSALGIAPAGNSGLSGITGLLGGLGLGSNIQETFGGIPGSRGELSEEVAASKNEFRALSAKLEEVETKMNNSFAKINRFKTIEQGQHLAITDIETLRTNKYLKPSRIKELINEEINYAFAKIDGEHISIDDLVNEYKKEEDLKQTINEYNAAGDEYKTLSKKWNNFASSISLYSVNINDMQMEFIKLSADSIQKTMEKNIQTKLSKPIESSISTNYKETNLKSLAALRQVYEEIQSDIFTYSFPPFQATSDDVVLSIDVSQKNSLGDYKQLKNLTQTVPVTGGWKISAGVGLSFGTLSEKTYSYSVLNESIVSDELDDFIPFVTSFAHFHKKNSKNFNLGGSFGVGFPIQGGASVQSLTFFIGPTLLLGKKQKFLLTAGFMGASVSRLSSGLKVGDYFGSFSNTLPMVQKYELGYFLGISYDILR